MERRLSTGAKKPRTTSDRTRSFGAGWRAKSERTKIQVSDRRRKNARASSEAGRSGGVTIAARETTLSAPYLDSPTVPQISVGSPPGAPRARNVQHTFNSLIYNSRRKKKEGGEGEGGREEGRRKRGGGERKRKGGKREGEEEGEEVERSARQRRRSEKIGEKNEGRVVEEEEERRGRGRRRRRVTEMVRLRRRRSRWKEVKTEGMPTPPPPLAPRWKRFDNAVRRSSTLYMERRPRGWSPAGRLARRHPGFIGTIGRVENHRSLT